MKFEDIKSLNLTDEDFKMLIDGLEALPGKDDAGDILNDIVDGLISKKSGVPVAEFEKKLKNNMVQKKKDRESVIENVRILQGKLLMLKRYLMESGALKQANQILNNGKAN